MQNKKFSRIVLRVLILFHFTFINATNNALWEKLINSSQSLSDQLLPYNGFNFEKLLNNKNVSQSCIESGLQTLQAIQKLDDWSIEMINSWGSFPPKGILEGTTTDLGSYDQCLSITPNDIISEPQYCIIDFSLPLKRPMPRHHNLFHQIDVLPDYIKTNPNHVFNKLSKEASFFYWLSLRQGICTPSKCTQEDIRVLINNEAEKLGLELKQVFCEKKEVSSLNFTQYLAIYVVMIFVSMCILSTACENFVKKNSQIWFYLKPFSLKLNFYKLVSLKTSKELSCIHGIRVWTMLWVIFGHTILWTNFQLYAATFGSKKMLTELKFQPLLNANNSVDIFFLISGMLSTFITMGMTKEKRENFSTIMYLLLRYLRLTPQLAIFILITFLLPLFGSGPIWKEFVNPIIDKCYENWWLNLLYVQNWFNVENMCAIHSWYLAADTQMHLLCPIILLAFLHKTKCGLFVNALFITAFFTITSIIVYVNDFPPAIIHTARDEHLLVFDFLMYFKPYPHAISFFTGLILGYFIYKRKFTKLSKTKTNIFWFLIIAGYLVALTDVIWWNHGEPYESWMSAIVYPTTRLLFAVCTASTIWLCLNDKNSIINKFLSCKVFVPFARLTYSVYLTHAWSIWIFIGTRRHLIEISMYSAFTVFLQHVIISFIFGTMFCLIFEMPILSLQKNFLKPRFYLRNNGEINNNEDEENKLNIDIQIAK